MKKFLLLLLIISPFFLTNCKWLKNKGIIGKKTAVTEYIRQLETTIAQDSAQIAQLKKESQAKVDSILKSCSDQNNAYYIITGSFRNPKYADDFHKQMISLGYKSEIVLAPNGFNLVSAFSGNDYKEAVNAMLNLRSTVNEETWLYVKN